MIDGESRRMLKTWLGFFADKWKGSLMEPVARDAGRDSPCQRTRAQSKLVQLLFKLIFKKLLSSSRISILQAINEQIQFLNNQPTQHLEV